jgi:Flp pilus assembly pilin Flp
MKATSKSLQRKTGAHRGQGLTETILIVFLVAILAIGVIGIFGDKLRAIFGTSAAELTGAEGRANNAGGPDEPNQ